MGARTPCQRKEARNFNHRCTQMHRAASAVPTNLAETEAAAGSAVPFGPSVCICVHLWLNHSSVRTFAGRVRNRSGKMIVALLSAPSREIFRCGGAGCFLLLCRYE